MREVTEQPAGRESDDRDTIALPRRSLAPTSSHVLCCQEESPGSTQKGGYCLQAFPKLFKKEARHFDGSFDPQEPSGQITKKNQT